MTGNRFGKLIAIREAVNKPYWEFQCDCGVIKIIRKYDVTSGRTISCGCHKNALVAKRNKLTATMGGLSHSPTGVSWRAMLTRCYNKNNRTYTSYGAIGITVCEFLRATPANMALLIGARPPGKSIDRINNLDGYHCGQCAECLEKEWALNVKWSTTTEQGRNQNTNRLITFNGETHCVTEWAEKVGITSSALRFRLFRDKWSIEKALTVPLGEMRHTSRRLTFNGETLCLPDWARKYGITTKALTHRLDTMGWPLEKALTTPLRITKATKFKPVK